MRKAVLFAFLSGWAMQVIYAEPAGETKKEKPAKRPGTGTTASLTGCIDEREGHYLLLNDRTLDPIADLVANGFPNEGFAKHLGHRVTVRGTSTQADTRPVFHVRSVETVSEMCTPEQ